MGFDEERDELLNRLKKERRGARLSDFPTRGAKIGFVMGRLFAWGVFVGGAAAVATCFMR